jgi:hypothetical protein
MTQTVFQIIIFWTVPPVYFRFCRLSCLTVIFFKVHVIQWHMQWFVNPLFRYKYGFSIAKQPCVEHIVLSPVLDYYQFSVPNYYFLNSATCIFPVLYDVNVLKLHWQQSFVYITNVYFKQWIWRPSNAMSPNPW